MTDYSTLITFFACIALACAVILIYLIIKGWRIDKEIEQCENIARAIECGATTEEILKMPMPKKMKKELEELYAYEITLNYIMAKAREMEELVNKGENE